MGQKDKNNKPILLEINTNGLNNSFYLDKDAWQSPDDVYNFWSNSNIPKENIKIIGQGFLLKFSTEMLIRTMNGTLTHNGRQYETAKRNFEK